jgi:hypothetical protein
MLLSVAVGASVALWVYHLIVQDSAPWAEDLRNLCVPKYSGQSTPFQNSNASFLYVAIMIAVNAYFCIFVLLPKSIDEVFPGAFALTIFTSLGSLYTFRSDFIGRLSAKKKALPTFDESPLNLKIYLIEVLLMLVTLLVYASIFDLTLYLQVKR